MTHDIAIAHTNYMKRAFALEPVRMRIVRSIASHHFDHTQLFFKSDTVFYTARIFNAVIGKICRKDVRNKDFKQALNATPPKDCAAYIV